MNTLSNQRYCLRSTNDRIHTFGLHFWPTAPIEIDDTPIEAAISIKKERECMPCETEVESLTESIPRETESVPIKKETESVPIKKEKESVPIKKDRISTKKGKQSLTEKVKARLLLRIHCYVLYMYYYTHSLWRGSALFTPV